MPNNEFVPRRGRVSLGWAAVLLLAALSTLAQAQDAMQPRAAARAIMPLAATGPRSSPYTPPDKDVFLTDASGGLDTGCTFNTSPLNPLTIDIPIDRFVGDVDANGFLVNPAAAITAGLIPASVDIVLPAFDVDYDGSPPPERDLVTFNGQSLGYLTGANNVWKLNTFRVDIRKLKFPARPAAGASPAAVMNRLQISIDTLGVNRWCTQIDWVAIVLPIRPQLALDLEVVPLAANPMNSDRGVAITKIQEQTFDANCKLSTSTGAIEDYPFSGPSLTAAGGPGSAKLRARIKACPEGSLKPPEVTATWSVDGTAKKGALSWSGLDKEVQFDMPPTIGAYTASLKLTLDNGQKLDATRRLYVTRKPPLTRDPRINWYKKGTEWARGESAEPAIVTKVRQGLYGYGNSAWLYGYGFGPGAIKCGWISLMDKDPRLCNYSDCFVFSDVLENISRTLGVDGFVSDTVFGKYPLGRPANTPGRSFLTANSPSLDPAFPGNARPVTGGAYDRYVFSSHSLRIRDSLYHDATFNKGYGNRTAFIIANFTGMRDVDRLGFYRVSEEGPRLYENTDTPRPVPYADWGRNSYGLGAPAPLIAPRSMMQAAAAVTPLSFPSASAWRTPDTNGDKRFDAIEVDVNVDIAVAGNYVVLGELQGPNGELVANTPAYESPLETRAQLSGGPGRRTITLRFSGEQIRGSRIDGPYKLVLYANGDTGAAGSASLVSPAFRWADFGERKLQLNSLVAMPIDADGSGKYETVRLSVEVDVAAAGPYQIAAAVVGAGSDLANRSRLTMLAAGVQQLTIDLPATGVARSGIDGPYSVTLNLSDANQASVGSASAVLAGLASQFEGVVTVGATPTEQLIDSNANGLYDLLRVGVEVRVRAPRQALVHATLVGANGASVEVDTVASLQTAAGQRVNLDFSGPLIRSLQMDSQYQVNLSFRDAATSEEFDALSLTLRGVYLYSRFDPAEAPRAIALTGTLGDRGIDTNGNGLFERLQVDLGVNVLVAGSCEWSARLVDRNGLELGFAANRGSLGAGAQTLRLEFDGRALGVNGLDGPYSVRSVLVACSNGANLVATFAGDTSAWRASQFEGYVVRLPADLNGDGRVDQADIDAFNRALGSSVGEAAYNRFADFDRDGRVTLNDLRLFRAAMRR